MGAIPPAAARSAVAAPARTPTPAPTPAVARKPEPRAQPAMRPRSTGVMPFFWRSDDPARQRKTTVVGPWISQRDSEGSTQVLAPIFWRFVAGRPQTRTTALLPLFIHRQRGDGSTLDVALPLLAALDRGPQHWRTTILPLLWVGQAPGRHHLVVPPLLLWHRRTPDGDTSALGPWYLRRHRRGWSTALLPLFFAGREGGRTHQVLFPLWWHFHDPAAQRRTLLAFPLLYRRQGQERLFGLLPIFAAGRSGGSRYLAILPPLFYRRDGGPGSRQWLLWSGPYVGLRDGERRVDTVVPLYFHERSATRRLLLTPVGGLHRDSARGLDRGLWGPYVWYRRPDVRAHLLLPFFVDLERPGSGSRTTAILPLALRHRSPALNVDVLFPLIWKVSDSTQRSLVVFPFYWGLRGREGKDADVLFPLYWHLRDKQRSLRVVGPAFWRKTPQGQSWGAAPLVYYSANARRRQLVVLPLFYYRNELKRAERLWVCGPFYWRSERAGYATGLVPLFFHRRAAERGYTVIPPLVWHFARPQAQQALSIFGPLAYWHTPERRALALAPVFYTSVDRRGGRSLAVAPLFYWRKEAQRKALLTPLFGFDRREAGTSWYALPFFHWRGPARTWDVLLPLGFRARDQRGRHGLFFTLPGYFAQSRPGRSEHVFFPIFWRLSRVDQTTTVVFPFYWDLHDRHLERTTAVFPFFLRHRNLAHHTTSYLAPPGIWVRRRPGGTDTVVFPVVWHFGGQRRSSTVGFPLYWDFRRPHRRSTIVFPFYWRFDRREHRTTVVLNTYFRRDKQSGGYDLVVFPLLQAKQAPKAATRDRDLSVTVLGGLFGYQRQGRKRTLRLFFIPFRLADRAPPATAAPASASPPGLRRSARAETRGGPRTGGELQPPARPSARRTLE
ncbi:MAG: hypothetical protein IPL40_03830 [Proteobacteria bacterium]|nr:hypothetical protein [Pseudomonadota bacterium]